MTDEAVDRVVIRSSTSGRRWGIAVDQIGGAEEITITELEPDVGDENADRSR